MAFEDDQLMHAEVGLSLPLEKFEAELDRAFGDFRSRVEAADQLSASADLALNLEPLKRQKKEVQAELKELELRKTELGVGISDADKAKLLTEMAELHAKLKAIAKDKLLVEVDVSRVKELQSLERAISKERRERTVAQRALEDSINQSLERRIKREKDALVQEGKARQENYARDKAHAAGLEKDEEAAYKRDQTRTNEKLKRYNSEKAAAAGLVKDEEAAYRVEDGRNRDRIRNLERIESLYRQRRANDEVAVISERGAAQRLREDLLNKEKEVNLTKQYRALGDDISNKAKQPKVVDLDIKRAEIKLALLRGEIEALGGDINIKINTDKGLFTKLKGLKEDIKDNGLGSTTFSGLRSGAQAVETRGGKILSGIGRQDLLPGPLHVGLGAALKAAPIILPALGSLTSLVGTAGYGLTGAGAVGGGLAAGLVSNFIGLAGALVKTKSEFESVSKAEKKWEEQVRKTGAGSLLAQKAFNEFQAVLHAVGPTAAKSEQELQKLLHTWTKFTQPARNAIVDVIGEVGRRGRALVPGLARNTNETAGVLRDHSRTFLDHVTSPEEIKRLDQLGKSANNFLNHALTGAENLGAVLFHVGEAAARIFGGELGKSFQAWAEGLNKAYEPGEKLDKVVKHLGEDAKDVWHFLSALTHVLLDLFAGGREGGEKMFKSVTEGLEGIDKQLKSVEGKKGLSKFFGESNELVKSLFPIFKEFAKLLGEWAIGLIPITKGLLKAGAEVTKILIDVSKLVGFNEPLVAMGETMAGIFLYKKFSAAVEATKLIYQNLKNAGGFIEGLKTIGKGELFKKTGVGAELEKGAKIGSEMWYQAIISAAEKGAIILREGGGVSRSPNTSSTGSKASSAEKLAEDAIVPVATGGFLSKLKGAGKIGLKGGAAGLGGYFGGQLLGELTGSSSHTTGVLSNVGAGAAGGFAVGGPLGAAAGAGLGLITSGGTKDIHDLIFGKSQQGKDVDTLNRIAGALQKVGGNLNQLNPAQLKELNEELNKLGHSDAAGSWATEIARLQKGTGPVAQGIKVASEAWQNFNVTAHTKLSDIKGAVGTTAVFIRQELGTKSAEAKAALASNFADAAAAVKHQMYLSGEYTAKGLSTIQGMFSKALAVYGIKAPKNLTQENFSNALESAQQGGNVKFNKAGGAYEEAHATGGFTQYGRPGETGQDSIRTSMLVAPGEVGAVFTKDQQAVANTLLAPVGGLPGLFQNYDRPHYMARGGFAPGLAFPGPQGRIDQGVDYAGPGPVKAVLPGTILSTGLWPGWPGTGGVVYSTPKGNVYVMEDFTPYVHKGQRVIAGQVIGRDDGGSSGIETGWANAAGTAPLVRYNGLADGTPTAGGKSFAAFLGGARGARGVGGEINIPHLKVPKTPLHGQLGSVVHGALAAVTAGANHALAKAARTLGGGGGAAGEIANVGNLKSLNHVFHAGVALSEKLVERIAAWAGLPAHLFAQIAHGESSFEPGQIEPTEGYHNGEAIKGYGLWQLTTGVGNDDLIKAYGGTQAMLNPLRNAQAAKALFNKQGAGAWHGTKYVTGHSKGGFFGSPALLVGEHQNEYVINPSREDNAAYLHQAATEMGYRVTPASGGKKPPVRNVLKTPSDLGQLPYLSEGVGHGGVPPESLDPVLSDISSALKTETSTYAKLTVQEKKALQKLAKNKTSAAHSLAQAYAHNKISVETARKSGANSISSHKRSVQNNPENPASQLALSEAERKAGEGVRKAETTGSLGIQNAKFHGDQAVKTAAKALEDIRKGEKALIHGGKWHDEKFIAIGKLEQEKNQGEDAKRRLIAYEKHIKSLEHSIKNVTHGMNIDSHRYTHASPAERVILDKDWHNRLENRKGLIKELEKEVGGSKTAAEKFIHQHPHSPHIGQVKSALEGIEDQIESIEDTSSETEGLEEGGISGQPPSALTSESFIEGIPGLSDQLKQYELDKALAETKLVPDNPNTVPNEEIPGLKAELGPSEKIQEFWEGVLDKAKGAPGMTPSVLTQIAQQVTGARSTAFGIESSIKSAEKGVGQQQFQESQAFSSARLELYRNFGSNFAPIWSQPATPSVGGIGGGGAAAPAGKTVNVNVTNNFSHPPTDPHTWSNGVGWELQAAI